MKRRYLVCILSSIGYILQGYTWERMLVGTWDKMRIWDNGKNHIVVFEHGTIPWTKSQWFAPTFPVAVYMICYNLVVPLDYHLVVSCTFPSPSHWVTFVLIPQSQRQDA